MKRTSATRLDHEEGWVISIEGRPHESRRNWSVCRGISTHLRRDVSLAEAVVSVVLNDHFPDSIHEDILAATHLEQLQTAKPKRDPRFLDYLTRFNSLSIAQPNILEAKPDLRYAR